VDFLVRNGLMPDLIIVGVTNTDRTRDLSPTRWARPGNDGGQAAAPIGGGADAFLDFFEKELIPYVEGHYRTQPYRLFAGHSLGGLLALYALEARPGLFDGVIAASPALNWDDDYILKKSAEFFNARSVLACTLFVTMANEEARDSAPTRFERLRTTLAAAKAAGFAWDSRSMPEENHGTVVLRTHYWGLRKVFEGWQLPANAYGAFQGSLADVKQHYATLSKRFRFAVVPPEQLVNQLGYQLLGRNDVAGAVEVFRYNVGLHPGSANPYDSLAEALARAGNVEESLANYEKAVAVAKETGDPLLERLTANRDRAVAAAKAPKNQA
jgi:predicted alpha/beta superfamily hydrolase